MRIRVDEIPESGTMIHFQWDEQRLARFRPEDDPVQIRLTRPVNVDLEIHRQADHVRVSGRVDLAVRLICGRCLADYPWDLEHRFETVLVPRTDQPSEDEIELEDSELDYEFFDGEVIDLELLVAEEVLLEVPLQTLCSEDCRGLCLGCGVDLNRETCRCSGSSKPSAFAKLESIRAGLPELPDK